MSRISLTPSARADLAEVNAELRRQAGSKVVSKYRKSFGLIFQRLSDHPESSPSRPEFGRGVRMAVAWPYVLLYRYEASRDRVLILRVLHGHRQISLNAP